MLLHKVRPYVLPSVLIVAVSGVLFSVALSINLYWISIIFGALSFLGFYDLMQKKHSIIRAYPIIGRLRYLLESFGPELYQYFIESNTEGRPFNRDQRALLYQRSKNIEGLKAFGSELNMNQIGYGFITHSISPAPLVEDPVSKFRVKVGGPECLKPYSSSIINISAMSLGSLSPNAIKALNAGAKLGNFAHNTGEGGYSKYHKEHGGDIIWQIGTGYFGCRNEDGTFNPDRFEERATTDQIKMIEIKISQGAKPGHGGILPGVKVTQEIAEARGIPVGQSCFSPPGHSAFSTPIELLEFIRLLRERSGGKPIGFKMCMGAPHEFFAICKAMLETGITPDYIAVDGAEGGTGAAPLEFSNHLGVPLREGLLLISNALIGTNLREKIKIAVSGKIVSSFEVAATMAMGANWCYMARGFMLALGCIQSQSCHTNECPVGVATQKKSLSRSLVVDLKAQRVHNLHKNTIHGVAEMTSAGGHTHPSQFRRNQLIERISTHEVKSMDAIYQFLEPGQLLDGNAGIHLQKFWDISSSKSFKPTA